MDVDRLNAMVDKKTTVEEDMSFLQELINTGEVWWLPIEIQTIALSYVIIGQLHFANRSYVAANGKRIPSQKEYEKAITELKKEADIAKKTTIPFGSFPSVSTN